MTFMAYLHSDWCQNRSSEILVSTAAVGTSPLQGEHLLKVLIFQKVIPLQTFHLAVVVILVSSKHRPGSEGQGYENVQHYMAS